MIFFFIVQEFDHPHKLLELPGGVFRGMINQLEGHGAEQLKQMAKQVCFPLIEIGFMTQCNGR